MAITNKHLEIQAQKEELREQIEAVWHEGVTLKKVPDFVNCGSSQIAVAWKKLVAHFHDCASPIPSKTSLTGMQELLTVWKIRLDQLTGKRPLL
jgi:exopolysaccharide biosynthesis predicted pyruvyltransferase EpsI